MLKTKLGRIGLIGAAVAGLGLAPAEEHGEGPVIVLTPEPEERGAFVSAEALLDALESADAGIENLTARIHYRKFFAIQSDEQERRGRLYFKTTRGDEESAPVRRFAVTFDELIVAGRRETTEQHYAFDGQWVIEKTPEDKQFTKRQVVPPGESFDPLKIGEGPFPVPIGQKKADILSRFQAVLTPIGEGLEDPTLVAFSEHHGLVQLLLTPRAGTVESGDFESVRIWYEPGGHMLPRIAKTVTPVGDESLVVLLDPRVNGVIEDGVFDTTIPPADEGWHVHISEYRRSAD